MELEYSNIREYLQQDLSQHFSPNTVSVKEDCVEVADVCLPIKKEDNYITIGSRKVLIRKYYTFLRFLMRSIEELIFFAREIIDFIFFKMSYQSLSFGSINKALAANFPYLTFDIRNYSVKVYSGATFIAEISIRDQTNGVLINDVLKRPLNDGELLVMIVAAIINHSDLVPYHAQGMLKK